MNNDQRRYLISQVEMNCKNQISELEKGIPIKPSLNNFLVAAVLDGSISFVDIEQLRESIKAKVLALGAGDVLAGSTSDWRTNKTVKETINLNADELFVIPDNYLVELKKYTELKSKIQSEINSLRATCQTIVMKIQLGSSSTMDKIIMQIDSMGDLNLMNSQLVLGS